MPAKSYVFLERDAWRGTKLTFAEKVKYEKPDIDKLRAEYIAKYGYSLLIPGFDDVIHYKPDEWMTREERMERKRRNLYRILASPTPNWFRSYSSVMVWLDNVQDAMTTGLMMTLLVRRTLPRLFARAVPILGWLLLGYDLLSFLVQLGRTPFTPMKSKRAACKMVDKNPFKKRSKRLRTKRLWLMKPTWAAMTEVLQTTDWLFGVGLALGSLFGTFADAAFMHYRQLTGEPVRVLTDPPVHEMYDITGFRSLRAAAMISSAGQVFDDETHFWTYITMAGNLFLVTPIIHDDPSEEYYEDPMNVLIPAPRPENPETIEVIRAEGLSIEDGVRWPVNGEKEIPLNELSDWQAVSSRDAITSYMFRNQRNWYGYLAAGYLSEATELLVDAVDPGAEVEEEYDPITHVTLQLLKQGITPTDETQREEWAKLEQWCADYRTTKKAWPGVREVTEMMDQIGLSYQTSFPATQDPRAEEVFPAESLTEQLWEETY